MRVSFRPSVLGLCAGALAGAADVGLIALADPTATRWVLLQSMLAWTATGWAVIASDTGFGSRTHGVGACLLLNLPWFVAFSFAQGKPEHLPPLVAMSVVFGLGFGFVHAFARR